jgi:murein DD-endopeptidase MepM/ murein hydrolase activator NlpD
MTQDYGPAGCGYCGYSYHTGIDWSTGGGAPVRAAGAGNIIARGGDNYGYGNKVIIDHGNGLWTLYAHLR